MRRIAALALVAGLILATAQAPASAGHPDATIVDTARGRGQVADFVAEHPEVVRRIAAAGHDSGDGLHPNDAGMAAMAAAIPVRLFR